MTTIQEEAVVQADGKLTLEVQSSRLRAGEKVIVYVVPVLTQAQPAVDGAKTRWQDFAGVHKEGGFGQG
jgi:hypothetical protein